jgi:hypothetical protein
MDPEAALREAAYYMREKDFDEANDRLRGYWEWRSKGGFQPKGGDRRAQALQEELDEAWESGEWDRSEEMEWSREDVENNPTPAQLKILRRQAKEIHEIQKDHAEEFLRTEIGSVWRVRDNTPGFEKGRWEYWVAPANATETQVRKQKASRYIGEWHFEVERVTRLNPKKHASGRKRNPAVTAAKRRAMRG